MPSYEVVVECDARIREYWRVESSAPLSRDGIKDAIHGGNVKGGHVKFVRDETIGNEENLEIVRIVRDDQDVPIYERGTTLENKENDRC